MKYLRLYENYYKQISLGEYIKNYSKDYLQKHVTKKLNWSFHNCQLDSLKCDYKFPNILILNVSMNSLINLEGIENFPNVKTLISYNNCLETLKGIEYLTNLEEFGCHNNRLKNLKGIENLTNLKSLSCGNNKLKNLKDIEKIQNNLVYLQSGLNDFDFPVLPNNLVEKFGLIEIYGPYLLDRFSTYENQKEFLTKYPEKVDYLIPFGFNEKIKEEFADLIEGVEFGFFGLKN